MRFVGVPTDSMQDMYTLSPSTAQASLTAYKSIMVATGTDHAERHDYGCCHGGQLLVEPTFV